MNHGAGRRVALEGGRARFVFVGNAPGKIDQPGDLDSYLLQRFAKITLAAEWRQKHAPQEPLESAEHEALADFCTPESEISARLSQRRLNDVLERLPALTRAVILMRLRDGTAYKEIASTIGITDRQVKRHLARGYVRLRIALDL